MVDETPESLLAQASKLTDKTDMAQINRRQELYLRSIALSLLKLTAKQETVVALTDVPVELPEKKSRRKNIEATESL